ncbi:SCO2525 family SAM-dependent methyltransferase [Micromonospora polyrhachis]|nr:SCO2525 family SAM-dependent methyltransferase [Micromonospora polyrhachis]
MSAVRPYPESVEGVAKGHVGAADHVFNDQFDWDHFDSDAYFDHNYRAVRDDDREIMKIVRDFFANADIDSRGRAVDVGAGTNLYPSLAMLPFCSHLDLWEYSASNVAWLRRQVAGFGENWDAFWDIYREQPAYAALSDPRVALAERTEVHQASVFDLPDRRWDLGTMFFVACSLSTDLTEFRRAVHAFVGALKPGAPFATAFMAKSQGYFVGDDWFPAVAIDATEVESCLATVATGVTVTSIEVGAPLRDGYSGMIVATGRTTTDPQ